MNDFDAHAALMTRALPEARQARLGRTQSRVWDGAEYGAAVIRIRRRANWADRAAWIASAMLACATIWLIYG